MVLDNALIYLTGNWGGVIFTLTLSIVVIYYVSSKLSDQLTLIGKKMELSPGIRGATFDAIGGSLPELFITIIALLLLGNKGLEIGIGTIGGSSIFNILIIPFLSVLFYRKGKIKKLSLHDINRDVVFFIFIVYVLFIGLYFNQLLILSLSLILIYIIYLYILYFENTIYRKKHLKKLIKECKSVKNDKVDVINIGLYIIILYIVIELSVKSVLFIASELNISHLVISLILLAMVTSAPDTILGIRAAQKGRINSSLGNAIGSNIFNICIGLGLPIFIGVMFMGLKPEINFNSISYILLFSILSTIIYMITTHIKKLKKYHFIPLFFVYMGFIGYIYQYIQV